MTDKDEPTILLSETGPVVVITLNRPRQYNAFNKAMRRELTAAVEYVERSDKIRVCIIRGAGPGFSAGADVTDFAYDPISLLIEGEFKPFLSRIYEGRKIYIAQVHGNVAGISVALAMTCDFMVMSEDASVYLAFAALGLVPDGGVSWNLLHALGRQRALHAIIEGQKIGAARCLDFGIAAKVVAPETLAEETAVWAERLAEAAPLAAAAAKRVLSGGARSGFVEAIGIEAQEQNQLVKTADFQRGLAAFAKRERPEFRGD